MPRAKKSPSTAKPRRASKKKRSLADLPPQPDPRAPLDSALLIGALQPVRKQLEEDLLTRAKTSAAITLALSARHAEERRPTAPRTRTPCGSAASSSRSRPRGILSCVFVRYSDKGLDRRAAWERTWDLQRREDAREISVSPKYDQKDFRDANYYCLRGKLDVPKERFISYPGCESDEDGEPVYGWAGWDHAQRAAALVALYNDRKTRESWPKERLIPMLAGVLELLPWLTQWHSEPMPDYDTTVAEAYEAFLDNELRDLTVTREHLVAWRPSELSARRAKS